MRLKTVSFGTTTIQKLRRVALDENLLETLHLKEGDTVRIELDVDSSVIVIRKAEQQQTTGVKTRARDQRV